MRPKGGKKTYPFIEKYGFLNKKLLEDKLKVRIRPVEYFLYLKSRQAAPAPGGAIRFSKNISEIKKSS
jgi:hypothetical protein